MINVDTHLIEVLKQLKSGTVLLKQKSNGKRFSRRFFLHERENFISYERSHKTFGKPRIYYIKDFDEIRSGFGSQTLHQLVKRGLIKPIDEPNAFSIMYDNHRQELHLIAPDSYTRNLWIEGLEYLKTQHGQKTQYHLIRDENWILNFFHSADKNRSNTLTKQECQNLLLDSFHIQIPDHIFEQMFRKADRSNEGVLNSEEFVTFFHLLTRRKDLYEIMKKYTKHQPIETISMNKDELSTFLHNRTEQIESFISTFEMNNQSREKGLLSLDGFRSMLLSEHFNIINPRPIYQDMTRPLCDYYINTSHNTQISGDSNPEAYNRVLLMGCRAVELDCYDGDDGSPIVTHAYTLVKSCSFESIIRAMEPNLFKTSPYPVILNIENHCSIKQQKQMAKILKDILGDRLLTKPLPNKDPTILPSPEDLKYKVLIRSKKKSTSKRLQEDDDDPPLNPVSKDIQPELAELFVYLQNVPYRDNDYAKANYSSFHSSSLAEKHFETFSVNDPTSLIQQTTWRLLRIYPDGLRQDSSNLNPVYAWNFGIQLAALNYQNDDDMTALNYGKFLDNGNCGYVLKPDYLFYKNFNPWDYQGDFDDKQILTITIISGQFLPKSHIKSSDIPDPYIRISTHGILCDEKVEKTKTIDNNAFDPIWNETFEFRIKFPQMCLIYFSVMDYDALTNDDRIAYFCAPINMIETGYRHIHLRANNNDPIHSTLFVYIDRQENETVISTRL